MKLWRAIWLMLILGATLAPAQAQIAPLFQVDDKLSADDPLDPKLKAPFKTHSMKLTAGKFYVIDLMSGEFDTFIRLLDSTGKV